MFNLTKPCSNCPFRKDKPFPLRRARKICEDLLDNNSASFTCHKTNKYKGGVTVVTENSQHCVGAMIFMESHGVASQIMRISERLGFYDYDKLEGQHLIYDSTEEMVKGCSGANKKKRERSL